MRALFSLAAAAGMWETLFFLSPLDRQYTLALSIVWGALIYKAMEK